MELLQQAEIVDRIIFHIEKNFRVKNCLKDLHEVIFVEYPVYEKVFQEQVNLTIHEYIVRLRTEQAVRLLEETQLDVKEVAIAVGINGYFEFVRIFEKQMGISPSKYRNQICKAKVVK
ncbi:AraC family transcriptional regulator [Solibacillus sp. R5-41]|nr:AraC family transcriptional regulator [Solibacillus sp. R5-41]